MLKPHEPDIITMAAHLADIDGIDSVNCNIVEIDKRVENARVTLVGDDIRYELVKAVVEELGGSVHSIDEVVAGAAIIDSPHMMQD
ncbi:MAG: DUF211 domain-containing protein [Myxococcales bacterium]|nr:DUF211 domain-containing protein [Myxococcales bacterium]